MAAVRLWSDSCGRLIGTVKTGQKQETPPTAMAGFLKAYAVWRCKVDGNGNGTAECKRNLLEHPDENQP